MFFLPFFIIGAYAFHYVWLKEIFLRCAPLAQLLLSVCMLNQKLLIHRSYMFELEGLQIPIGVVIANLVFTFEQSYAGVYCSELL